MYAISTRGLQDDLKAAEPDVAQAWFADDNAAGAGIISLKSYWDTLNDIGPPYGFHPKASKCVLIIKDAAMREQADVVFAGTGVRITTEGDRHIGAVLGSEAFKTRFVTAKVGKWVQDVAELAKIAEEEPQCALSAFNCGLSQRWSFLQRTVSGIGELFNPLEDAIRQQLIPALIGRHVSDLERRLLALPYRHGGLGIRNPTLTAQPEYDASCRVTEDLSALIYQQETDVSKLDTGAVKEKKSEVQTAKEALLKNEAKEIAALLDEKQRKLFVCASEKGASSWLSALPLKKLGYVLNKQEFRDAICLRYGWQIPQTPTYCGCGSKNDFDHILTCKKGGYVSMRHNVLRDVQAAMLTKVCTDVRVEPSLLPTDEERTAGNTAPGARLDISARGIWSRCEKTYMDVRVTHPTSQSHVRKSMEILYRENEREKKNLYNDRIINTERGSFTPLVFSTTGGMAPECACLNRRVAELIAAKTGEAYSHVMKFIRTRLRFAR